MQNAYESHQFTQLMGRFSWPPADVWWISMPRNISPFGHGFTPGLDGYAQPSSRAVPKVVAHLKVVARLQVRHQSGLLRFPPQQLARDSARGGFDQTAVADIAARAGLTERTFFNCFADKREVLFHGAEKLESFLVESMAKVPASASATEAVAAALDAVAYASDERPEFAEFARRRHGLLQLHAELGERELTKLASLGSAMAGALRSRGVSAPSASLAAEVGIAVFN